MRRLKRVIILVLCVSMILGSANVLNAATKTKDLKRTTTYYDSIITSWKLGTVTSKISFSYNDVTDKLVDQKSASVTGTVTGYSVKNKKAKWDWYNTSDKAGSGQVTCSWELFFGIDTAWIKIGVTDKDVAERTRVYGDYDWEFLD